MSAIISQDGLYRYKLTRILRSNGTHGKGLVVWLMFNPSDADAIRNDATVRKVIGFSCRWGFDELDVYNFFGYRSPHPSKLWKITDPIGPENHEYLKAIPLNVPLIAAWGAIYKSGRFDAWIETVKAMVRARGAQCLGKCNDGSPRHPLMLAYNTPLEIWTPAPLRGEGDT